MADGLCVVDGAVSSLMDNIEVKINEKLISDEKSVSGNNIECVDSMNEKGETQKCEKKMSEILKCPSVVVAGGCATNLINNTAIVVATPPPPPPPPITTSLKNSLISSSKKFKSASGSVLVEKQKKLNGLLKTDLKPPQGAKDIDDIRKKRRCTDRYDSSESSDR